MPSRRHGSATLASPRRPSRTMQILSSAEKCRRVARRMSLTTRSAGAFVGPDFCLIFAPSKGYDEPEILPSSTRPICLTIHDVCNMSGQRVIPDRSFQDLVYEYTPYAACFFP